MRDLDTPHRIVVYCKGAELFVIKKCVTGDFDVCMKDIDSFAEQGWRTLAFSYRVITENQYKIIKQSINAAYNDILNREKKLAQAFEGK